MNRPIGQQCLAKIVPVCYGLTKMLKVICTFHACVSMPENLIQNEMADKTRNTEHRTRNTEHGQYAILRLARFTEPLPDKCVLQRAGFFKEFV